MIRQIDITDDAVIRRFSRPLKTTMPTPSSNYCREDEPVIIQRPTPERQAAAYTAYLERKLSVHRDYAIWWSGFRSAIAIVILAAMLAYAAYHQKELRQLIPSATKQYSVD